MLSAHIYSVIFAQQQAQHVVSLNNKYPGANTRLSSHCVCTMHQARRSHEKLKCLTTGTNDEHDDALKPEVSVM